jgi:hypothetical protein
MPGPTPDLHCCCHALTHTQVDGKMLAQSSAIERYAARIGKLLPEGDWEMAKNDEIVAFNQVSQSLVKQPLTQEAECSRER